MDRNLAKVRGIGLSTAAVVVAGGLSALGQWGDRLGSPHARPDDFVSHAFVDSLTVGVVLFFVLGVTLVVFLVVDLSESGLTGPSPNALWLDLPVDFAERFVGQADTVLQAAGFEVEPTDFVDVSGTRASPVRAKDAIAFDGPYSFTAAVSPAPDLGALDDGPQTLYRLRFEASSPCLRPE